MASGFVEPLTEVLNWNEKDVTEWLEKIGLSKYRKRFKNNRVTGAVLIQLDETLLDDLNINNIIDRDSLLEEVTKLGGGNSSYDGYDFDDDDDDDDDDLSSSHYEILSTINEEEEELEELENDQVGPYDQERMRKISKGERSRKTSKERKNSRGNDGKNNENERVRKNSKGSDVTSTDNERVRKNSKGDEATNSNKEHAHKIIKDDEINDESEHVQKITTVTSLVEDEPAVLENDLRKKSSSSSHEEVASRATQMVEILSDENATLRAEIASMYEKTENVEKLEAELAAVRAALQQVELASKKRESLEESMRARLESELTKLQENNKNIKDQMESVKGDLAQNKEKTGDLERMKKELQLKEEANTQLHVQKKSFLEVKQRLERNLHQSRDKITNLEKNVEILNSALKNSKKTVLELQTKLQRKTSEVDHLNRIKSGLRDSTRSQASIRNSDSSSTLSSLQQDRHGSADEGIAEIDGPTCVPVLMEFLKEKDEKIANLEFEKSKLEQKHFEDMSSRKFSLEGALRQKDARISALERTAREGEKLIAEYRTQNLKYIEEIYVAHRRCSDLEVVIKSLQAQVAEKDSMIKILQGECEQDDDTMSVCSWKSFRSLPPDMMTSTKRRGTLTPNYYDISSLSFSYSDLTTDSIKDQGDMNSTDSGMSVTIPSDKDIRIREEDIADIDEEENVEVHYWCV